MLDFLCAERGKGEFAISAHAVEVPAHHLPPCSEQEVSLVLTRGRGGPNPS